MKKINAAAKQMNSLAKSYMSELDNKTRCVHRALVLRSLAILKDIEPDAEKLLSKEIKTLVTSAKRPDNSGDYENGMGRHYYCVRSVSGKQLSPVNSYFRNGIRRFPKSPRAMFEEDYTMALTMYRAGHEKQAAEFLGRAIHMVSDMCCLPHTASMTYFSKGNKLHRAYELLAESIYPERVPEQKFPDIPGFFNSRSSFADDLNTIAMDTANALDAVIENPYDTIVRQLLRTERILVALLLRFYADTSASDREAHFIANGSGCRLMKGTSPLTAKITKKGVTFHGVNPCPESKINVTDTTFYAAHRHDGLFTLSPVKSNDGLVLEFCDGKLLWKKFDPVHGEQLFRL